MFPMHNLYIGVKNTDLMEYIEIGHVIKAHGLKGEMKILTNGVKKDILRNTDVVFISLHGQIEPHFIEYVKGEDPIIIKLEEFDTKESVQAIVKSTLMVHRTKEWLALLDQESNEDDGYDHLIGYHIMDLNSGQKHEIVSVEAFPQQTMAFVRISEDLEVPIPLNDTFIEIVDHDHKVIQMDLPDGLLQ